MKRKKISSTIIIMLTMCLAVTGCSGEPTNPTTSEKRKITVQTQTQTEIKVTEAETESIVETELIAEPEKATENTESTKIQKKLTNVKIQSEKPDELEHHDTTTVTVTKPSNTNSNTELKKPTSNNNTSNNNIISNKTESSDNKPSSKPVTVTDDTKVSHAQFNTAENMQRMVSYIISHNQSKGMTYDSTLNTSNSGWLFAYQGCLNTTATRSYNEQLSRTVNGLDEDIDSILALDGYATSYSQMRFNCYAERQSDGEYNIYFCYG